MSQKVLITSALPYVNNVPHLGNMVCMLSADAYARYLKLRGVESIFVCGTDEHGTTTETKAIEEHLTPKEVCDKYYKIHKEVYDWFECGFDCFGRTSDKENHELTQDIFLKLHKNGFVFEDEIEQFYCEHCKMFLADRFVEGTCPKCNYADARGDQCDSCGSLLNSTELVKPRCKICSGTPIIRESKHLFLDLPKIEKELKVWVEKASENWTQSASTMANALIKDGLKSRCITRDIKWGINVPLKGFEEKVFYVWFDAPIGYISITKKLRKDWRDWWHSPDKVRLVQFMGKDILLFHTIMFPAFLIGTRDNYTLVNNLSSNEFLNYEDAKFSKSRGTGIFGDDAMETGIRPCVWRYYLMVNRPEASDTVFLWNDFQDKNNNELLANLGNFVNRTLTFLTNNFEGKMPKAEINEKDDTFFNSINAEIESYIKAMDKIDLKEGLKIAMRISRLGNQYFQENEPWKLVKGSASNVERCGTAIAVCVNLIKVLAVLIEPFMPGVSEDILSQLGLKNTEIKEKYKIHLELKSGHKIGVPKTLFRKLEEKEIVEFKKMYAGKKTSDKGRVEKGAETNQDSDIFPLDLRVAKILEVTPHPDADKLYVVRIDLGTEKRQLVAGIRNYYTPEQLIGKHIVVICNLKYAKLRGVESQGMLLAAGDEEGKEVAILEAAKSSPGDKVSVEGIEVKPKQNLDFKEFQQLTLVIGDKGVATFNGKPLKTSKESISAKIIKGAKIR